MKRFLCLVLAFLMITSISVTAYADIFAEANGSGEQVSYVKVEEPTRQEETVRSLQIPCDICAYHSSRCLRRNIIRWQHNR